jgi:hypothetical protein
VTFFPFVLLAIAVFLLPLNWGLRAWALAALPLLWSNALTPITPFQYAGPFDGLQGVLLGWVFGFATLGFAARAFWTLAKGPLDWSALSRDMQVPDCILATAYGLLAGLVATLLLAAGLRGFSGGLALHLAVAGLASIAVYAAMRLPILPRCLTVTAFATLLCLTLVGAVAYPQIILSRAETILPGASRCLRTPEGRVPTTDELRLLTLPKAEGRRPNLVLTVMTDGGLRDYRWSYRSNGFRSYDSYDGGPCPAS